VKNSVLFVAGLASLTGVSCKEEPKPNVIFVLADDLGYGDVSAFNPESKIQTPNIDAMSRGGISFTDAHATSSLSTPSRYSIITGRYSWRTPLKQGAGSGYSEPLIKEGRSTIASMLSANGYNTACIGKWHLGWNWAKLPDAKKNTDVDFSRPVTNGVTTRGGFDYFFGIAASLDMPPYVYVENEMPTAVPDSISESRRGLLLYRGGPIAPDCEPAEVLDNIFKRSMDFVTARKGSDEPFFLYMPLTAPHTPVLPSAEYQGKTEMGPYGDFVTMVDALLGKLVATLKANGQWENTIVVFTSDNGFAPAINPAWFEERGHYPGRDFRGYKTDIYEGGHRVPLVVTWGDRYKGITDRSLVSLSDFYATFAEMAGHELRDDEAEDSFSLWNILRGKGGSDRKDLISLSGRGYFALRTPDLKLIFWPGSGGGSYPSTRKDMAGLPDLQLYDMNADEQEQRNLVGEADYAEKVAELTARMRSYMDNGRSTPGKPQSNDTGNNWEQTEFF
jgi:arylsulfatase A-like enzyme